jgi:hypothetical protein
MTIAPRLLLRVALATTAVTLLAAGPAAAIVTNNKDDDGAYRAGAILRIA